LGYDFTGGKGNVVVPKKKKEADRLKVIGHATSHLFMFAIYKSASGPPRGFMKFGEDTNDEMAGGTAAFLRAVQHYLPMSFQDLESIGEYVKRKIIPDNIGERKQQEGDFTPMEEEEKSTNLCKLALNPLVILLHVDQGSFADGRYTPFATPRANNRSIYEENVQTLTRQLMAKEKVVNTEDFSIVPYELSFGNMINAIHANLPKNIDLFYRCTLNRDNESKHCIISKDLILPSFDRVADNIEVSDILHVWYVTPELMDNQCSVSNSLFVCGCRCCLE
jgi:hypothetical protein